MTTMIKILTCVVVVGTCVSSLSGQTILFPGLQGEELQQALRENYRPAFTLSLADAKDTLYSVIDNVQDSVEGIYSGYTLYLPDGVDASQWLYQNGTGINLEHSFPQSKGADEGMAGHSDMHHLYPSRVAVNEARASWPFEDIPDNTTSTWYRDAMSMQSIPTTDIDEYSEYVSGVFEPRESVKGNIARSMFYFYTMYQDDADAADPTFFASQRMTLCVWHLADPADDREMERSAAVAQYQDGKENPFVLDCTAALRAWCPEFQGCTTSTTDGVALLPLRMTAFTVDNHIHVRIISELAEKISISVYDVCGRLVSITPIEVMSGTSEYQLSQSFPSGIYTLLGIADRGGQRSDPVRCVVY